MTDTYTKAAVAWERIQEVLQTKRDIEDCRAPCPLRRSRAASNSTTSHSATAQLAGAPRREFPHRARRDGGAGGPDRFRKIDHHQPGGALLRSHRRRGENRRIRHPAAPAIDAAPADRLRAAGDPVVPRDHRDHIAYGKSGATMEEIVRAAELANASEFIDKMPDGYDTVVGERGVTLSGGQRQRIAIARALIRSLPILIWTSRPRGWMRPPNNWSSMRWAACWQGGRRL